MGGGERIDRDYFLRYDRSRMDCDADRGEVKNDRPCMTGFRVWNI